MKENKGQNDARLKVLRDAIIRASPAVPYSGPITNCDGANEIFKVEPDGFVLLTNDAFVVYVAAWLMRALDNISGENQVPNVSQTDSSENAPGTALRL